MASISYYLVKILLTSILIVAVSEAAKRSSLLGGLFASLPLISIIVTLCLYRLMLFTLARLGDAAS